MNISLYTKSNQFATRIFPVLTPHRPPKHQSTGGDGQARKLFGGWFGACSQGCVGSTSTTTLPSCSHGQASMLSSVPGDANSGEIQALDSCSSLEPALGVHQGAQNEEKTLCLPSLEAPKGKLFRNAPNLSPSTAERGPGVLWFQADACSRPSKSQGHSPSEYLLPTTGTLQPQLKTTTAPSEMGQPVSTTDRNTLSSEFKGLRGVIIMIF